MTLVLALRGATTVVVLTLLVGGVPRVVSVALAVTLGLWSALVVAPLSLSLSLVDGSLVIAAREVVIGATLGVMAALPLLAAVTAGRLVDLAATGRAHGPYGMLFGVLAAAVFVGIDGHVAVVTAIIDSHRVAPAATDADGAVRVVAMIGALVPSAVRLAIPWLVTAAVVEVAVGAGVRVARRAAVQAPVAAAVPAALVAVTASLVGALAIAMAAVIRG